MILLTDLIIFDLLSNVKNFFDQLLKNFVYKQRFIFKKYTANIYVK